MPAADLIAGAVQTDVRLGSTSDNLARALAGVRALAARGAKLIALPEMFTCGFDNGKLAEHSRQSEGIISRLSEAAARYGLFLCGSLPELSEEKVHNVAVAVGPDGKLLARYRKIHLFRPTDEHRFFAAGNKPALFDTPWGPAGIMTCYDLRFPELARSLASAGARMLLVPAQWPAVRAAHWDLLLAARAVENQVFVIGSNASGFLGDLALGGHSSLISPWGKVLARAGARPARISAVFDMEEVDRARQAIPVWEDRKPGAYEMD